MSSDKEVKSTLNMGIKNTSSEDRCFCEIGIDLEFFTVEQAQKALEEQRVEATIGNHKKIGAFLFEQGLITKDQISKILRIQDKLDIAANDSQGKDTPTTEPTPIGMYFVLVITGISILGQISSAASTSITSFLIMYGISFFAGIVYSLGVCLFSLASIISFIITIHYFKNGPRHLPKLKLIANICAVVAAIGIYSTDFGGLYYSSSTMNLKLFKDAVESSQVPELAPIKQAVSYGYNSAILEFAKGYLFFAGFLYLILLIQWGVIRFCIPSAQPVEAGSSHIGNAAVSDKSLNSAASGGFEPREASAKNNKEEFLRKFNKQLRAESAWGKPSQVVNLAFFGGASVWGIILGGKFLPEFTLTYLVLVIVLSSTNIVYVCWPSARVRIKKFVRAFKQNSDFANMQLTQEGKFQTGVAHGFVENVSVMQPNEDRAANADKVLAEELISIQWLIGINMLLCLIGLSCYHNVSLPYASTYLVLFVLLFFAANRILDAKIAFMQGVNFFWEVFTPKSAGEQGKILHLFGKIIAISLIIPGTLVMIREGQFYSLINMTIMIVTIFWIRKRLFPTIDVENETVPPESNSETRVDKP